MFTYLLILLLFEFA